jgi:hypothetical protein
MKDGLIPAAIDEHSEAQSLGPEGRRRLAWLLSNYPEISIDEALEALKEHGAI